MAPILVEGCHRNVENDGNTLFWKDKWLVNEPLLNLAIRAIMDDKIVGISV